MPVHLLRDADIKRIAIVDKGANRKQFFLYKREGDEGEGEQLGHGRILKADDWSAVYCVVAEPGWHEAPGIGADAPDIEDRWASEDEIRKAAHRFMKNGGLLNKMHESLDPYGDLVENAVALADFEVGGEIIRKGSWYIAFEPNAEGKELIEKGVFGGVSIEGTAVRELVEKGKPAGSTRPTPTVDPVEKTLLQKIAEAVGLSKEEIADLEKANRTFGEIVASREFDEALPMAFDAFQSAIWNAFFPNPGEDVDPVALITESCDEFKAWTLDKLETVPVSKAERAEALGVDPDRSRAQIPTFESEDTMTDAETKRLEKLETAQAEMAEGISKLTEGMAEIAKAVKPEPEAPTVESVAESVADLSKGLEGIKADIAKLGSGGSSQNDPPADITKAEDEAAIKSFEAAGVKPALAGVLGG